jgi:hypothetical protein
MERNEKCTESGCLLSLCIVYESVRWPQLQACAGCCYRSPQTVRCKASSEQTVDINMYLQRYSYRSQWRNARADQYSWFRFPLSRNGSGPNPQKCCKWVTARRDHSQNSVICIPNGVPLMRGMLFRVLISRHFGAWNASKWFDMEMKSTNAYKQLTVYYKHSNLLTCTYFGHTCGFPQGGGLLKIHKNDI